MPDSKIMAEIENLKKKLEQNPESLVFVPLADAYRKAGMFDEAIEVCKKGLEKHSTYASARVVLGRIYIEKNMLEDAIEELKKAESIDDNNIMVHSMLGNAYLKKKRYAEAVEQFQKVLSLNPEDTEIQEKLKLALSASQEPEIEKEAEEKEKEKKKEKPKIDIKEKLKEAEEKTKNEEFEKAIEIYNEIIKEDPENLIVQQRLREVYDFQEKKLKKEKAREEKVEKQKGTTDKITAEDILDVMKEAIEDETIEEEKEKEEEKKIEKKVEESEEKKVEEKLSVDSQKINEIENVFKNLSKTEGIIGSFYLTREGKIIASVLPEGINKSETERLIAQIVDKTERSVKSMEQGKLNQCVFASEKGQLIFTEIGKGVLFLIGNNEKINVGRMSLLLKNVVNRLKEILA